MAKTVYEATAPDGTVITRTTDRVYTHAVLANDDRGWGCIGFCGSFELAQKLERTTRNQYAKYRTLSNTKLVIVPAVSRTKPPRN